MISADTLDDQGRNPGFDDPAARLQPPPNIKIAISVDGGLYKGSRSSAWRSALWALLNNCRSICVPSENKQRQRKYMPILRFSWLFDQAIVGIWDCQGFKSSVDTLPRRPVCSQHIYESIEGPESCKLNISKSSTHQGPSPVFLHHPFELAPT